MAETPSVSSGPSPANSQERPAADDTAKRQPANEDVAAFQKMRDGVLAPAPRREKANAEARSTVVVPDTPGKFGNITRAAAPGTEHGAITESAPGSSPDHPIPVTTNAAMLSLTRDQLIEGIQPEAGVVALKGSIGVQDIPGWDKIPGLSKLASNAQVNYLAAVITPLDIWKDAGLHVSPKPLDSTLFLSIGLPNRTPLIVTTKLKDLNFEAGTPILNQSSPDGRFIFFSNKRAGATVTGPDAVGSANWGFLVRVPNMGRAVGAMRSVVTWGTRAAETAEAAAAVAGAPETGGGSLAAGALSVAGTEVVRNTILRSLGKADVYLGAAWRASASAGIHDGHLTMVAQKGELQGKWIDVDLRKISGAFFESTIPDFEAPNRQRLLELGMTPKTVDILSPFLVKHDVKPFLEQTAAYLHVSTADVIKWFDGRDPVYLQRLTRQGIGSIEPDASGIYSRDLTFKGERVGLQRGMQSIADLDRYAAALGHPMPGSSWTVTAAAKPWTDEYVWFPRSKVAHAPSGRAAVPPVQENVTQPRAPAVPVPQEPAVPQPAPPNVPGRHPRTFRYTPRRA